MVRLLVDAGADLRARDEEHEGTPLDWAKVAIEVTNNPKCQAGGRVPVANHARPDVGPLTGCGLESASAKRPDSADDRGPAAGDHQHAVRLTEDLVVEIDADDPIRADRFGALLHLRQG